MANNRDNCDFCCNPQEVVRYDLTFRTAIIYVLCQILTALGGGGGSGSQAGFNQASKAGTAGGITTGGVSVLTNSQQIKIFTALNTTDKDILLSLDGGTTYPYMCAAGGGSCAIDLGANGLFAAGSIKAKAPVSDTTAGVLYVGITYKA